MKGIINLPAFFPACDHIVTAEEVFAPTHLRRIKPAQLAKPNHGFTAPHAFVAACYANSCDGRARTIGRQVNVKV